METNSKVFDLNLMTYCLLESEPFFAAFSVYVTKIPTNSIPTAGVTADKNTTNFIMYYNPEFFKTLTTAQKLAVIKHEFYHIILEHITGRKPTNIDNMKLWNIATDLAINSFLEKDLPTFCYIPGNGMFQTYPKEQAAEWYFKKLQNDKQFAKDNNSENGNGQFDDHSQWSESADSSTISKELISEKLKNILRKSVNEVLQRGSNWGSISDSMRKEIMSRINTVIDWRKVLRYFIKTSQRSDKSSTQKRINKRTPYINPGRKMNRHANIAISIDQSGSVSDLMLIAFFAELNKLSSIATFTVIPFDCEVAEDKIYIWKRRTNHICERVLQGDTDFNAPTKYVNDHSKFDGHIILTDMCAPKPVKSMCQRMWITSSDCIQNSVFKTNEKVIAIPISNQS